MATAWLAGGRSGPCEAGPSEGGSEVEGAAVESEVEEVEEEEDDDDEGGVGGVAEDTEGDGVGVSAAGACVVSVAADDSLAAAGDEP